MLAYSIVIQSYLPPCVYFQVTTANASAIVTTTLSVVLFTTFVLGGSTEPLLRVLKLKNAVEPVYPLAADGIENYNISG